MVQEQSYATGGWGPDEAFVEPGQGLPRAKSLGKTRSSFETPCGAYGQFKITRYLLRVTQDSRYGDSMEQVLYNTIAGAKPIRPDGISFYYSDYNDEGAKKVYYKDKWPCCSGTFPQLTADYGISAYYPAKDGIYVNLFLPSRLAWTQNGSKIAITQHPSGAIRRVTGTAGASSAVRRRSISASTAACAWTSTHTRAADSSVRPPHAATSRSAAASTSGGTGTCG